MTVEEEISTRTGGPLSIGDKRGRLVCLGSVPDTATRVTRAGPGQRPVILVACRVQKVCGSPAGSKVTWFLGDDMLTQLSERS